jgi:dipeptidyl-peptidase-4
MLKNKNTKGTQMKGKTILLITLVLGILTKPSFISAQDNKDVLTLERIFKDKEFVLNEFGPAVWLEDGSGYTTLEESGKFPMAKDIIKYNPKSLKLDILVDAIQLIPK